MPSPRRLQKMHKSKRAAKRRGPQVSIRGELEAARRIESLLKQHGAEIFASVEKFYKAYYFRPRPIARMLGEMLTDFDMMKRRLREGVEFFRFLRLREASN